MVGSSGSSSMTDIIDSVSVGLDSSSESRLSNGRTGELDEDRGDDSGYGRSCSCDFEVKREGLKCAL